MPASSVGLVTIQPVAAAAPLTPLLTGPPTTGTVLAVFRAAALLGVTPNVAGQDRAGAGSGPRIVSLLSRQASGTPNGVRLPVSAADLPFAGLRVGQPATLGAREIAVDDLRLRLARTWRTTVPTIRPTTAALTWTTNYCADVPIGLPGQQVSMLAEALAAADAGGDAPRGRDLRPAVRGLVGLGKGLTPGGDDVLAGLLVGLRATGRRVLLQQVRRAIGSDVADRTTAISVDLLRLAAAGHAATETLRLLGALHAVGRMPPGAGHLALLQTAVDGLLAVGHTSGADLLQGLLLGLRPTIRTTIRAATGSCGATPITSVTPRKATT